MRGAIEAILRKDLKAVTRARGVLVPLIIVPVIMLVLLPALVGLLPTLPLSEPDLKELDGFLASAPEGLKAALARYGPVERLVFLALVYFVAPLYLIVPLMVSSVIAADSFAGEKERKTLEALLYTPTTDRELFLAKVLAPWVAAVSVGLLGFAVYSVVGNVVSFLTMRELLFPNALWLLLAFWLGPSVAGLGLVSTVLVSSRVSSFQEAFQLGGVVVLPVVALMISQLTGLLYFSVGMAALLGLVVWLLDGALLVLAFGTFRRDRLASRL